MHILKTIWRFIKYPLYVLLALYLIVVVYRVFAIGQEEKSAALVADIAAIRLSEADVDGSKLPPAVPEQLKDATLAGVDANENHIRDDVEHELFSRYASDDTTRAAALQYAMGLQLYLTHVIDSPTLVAVLQVAEHGNFCLSDTVPTPWKDVSEITQELATPYAYEVQELVQSVKDLVFNTEERKTAHERVLSKYMTTYGGSEREHCDLSL